MVKKPDFKVFLILFLFVMFPGLFTQNQTFTLPELAKYNGENGTKAYVAVDGRVYDVTGIPRRSRGRHLCLRSFAGKDITGLWKHSSHSVRSNFLSQYPVVGTLVSRSAQPTGSPVISKTAQIPKTPPGRNLPKKLIFLAAIVGTTIIWLTFRNK